MPRPAEEGATGLGLSIIKPVSKLCHGRIAGRIITIRRPRPLLENGGFWVPEPMPAPWPGK